MGAILKSKASANAQHWALKQQSRRSWIKPTALPYTQGVGHTASMRVGPIFTERSSIGPARVKYTPRTAVLKATPV